MSRYDYTECVDMCCDIEKNDVMQRHKIPVQKFCFGGFLLIQFDPSLLFK